MANEKRLIDAYALEEEIERIYEEHYKDSCYQFIHDLFRAMLRRIRNAETVDAVEVVRCKDCIGKACWYKNDYGCTICGLSGLFVVEDRYFCAYGERRIDNA